MERETWAILSALITRLDNNQPASARRRVTHSRGRIARVYFRAACQNRATYWACDPANWKGIRRPRELPNQSTMSRRLRTPGMQQFLRDLVHALGVLLYAKEHWIKIIDGMPLTVARHSQDKDATFGRGAGGPARGYKLHAIYGQAEVPVAWSADPLNVDEREVAKRLIPQLQGQGELLGDAFYDANALYDLAATHDHTFKSMRRYKHAKGVGHCRQSPHRLAWLARIQADGPEVAAMFKARRTVETRFANLCNYDCGLTCLPPFVRGLVRVRNWVAAKLAQRAARSLAKRRMRRGNA